VPSELFIFRCQTRHVLRHAKARHSFTVSLEYFTAWNVKYNFSPHNQHCKLARCRLFLNTCGTVSVCAGELCKNGRTDHDAVWIVGRLDECIGWDKYGRHWILDSIRWYSTSACCRFSMTTVYLFNDWLPRPLKPHPPMLYLCCAKCLICHLSGLQTPKKCPSNLNLSEIIVECTYCPSFIILCLLIQKLSRYVDTSWAATVTAATDDIAGEHRMFQLLSVSAAQMSRFCGKHTPCCTKLHWWRTTETFCV